MIKVNKKNKFTKNKLLVVRRYLQNGFSYFARTLDESLVDVGALKEKIELGLSKNDVTRVERVYSCKEPLLQTLAN